MEVKDEKITSLSGGSDGCEAYISCGPMNHKKAAT